MRAPSRSTGMRQLTQQKTSHAGRPRGASRGDRRGDFERLYRESRDDLYSYLTFLLANRSLAEEVTAQAFERAYRKRSSFDSRRGDLRAWLFRIARNAAIDELRRGRREIALDFTSESAATMGSAGASDEAPGEPIDRVYVATALRTLAPNQRELVALKFFAGLTNVEIARVLRQSESNVGSRLHRAITSLREALND